MAENFAITTLLSVLGPHFEDLPIREPKKPSETNFIAVTTEPRIHPRFKAIVKNILYTLNSEFALQIFHGTENEEFIKTAIPLKNAIYTNFNKPTISYYDHEALLTTSEFWNMIPCENILIFELDSFFLKPAIPNIYEFCTYDYIGASWEHPRLPKSPVNGRELRIGNGGFSLRKKSKTLEITNNHKFIHQFSDIFFADYFFDKNIPTLEIADKFSIEQRKLDLNHLPLGIHSPISEGFNDEKFLKELAEKIKENFHQ